MSGAERATLTSSSATHCRDSVNVPRVPKQQWLETNTLYYDDAEGPNRIGNYNVSTVSRFIDYKPFFQVHPWKTGTEDSYKNAKISGDTVDGYNPMNVGAADPKA